MNKKRFSLNNLLQNSKFLLVCSVVISVCIWMYMSYTIGNDTTVTITDIPVQIELPDDAISNGLQIFSGADTRASITISGNRATVGSINQSDIVVTGSGTLIDSSGYYTLSLSASKSNPYADYQFVSTVSPSTVEVFVDYLRESSFEIQDNVVYKVSDGYYASTSLSTKNILISGPQTEVSKIAKVSAVANVNEKLNASTVVSADIVLYDSNGNELDSDLFTIDNTSVEVSISVLPEKTVKVKPVYINKPSGLKITDDMITVEPSSILIAGTKDVLDITDSVNLEPIDFSTLKNEKATFNLGIDIPTDCKNISNESSAKVTLDLSSLTTKKLTVEKFTVDGLSSDYRADVTQKNIEITVVGPKSELDDLSPSDVTAVIDASASSGMTGSVSLPVTFNFQSTRSSWSYGSYKANLTITEK